MTSLKRMQKPVYSVTRQGPFVVSDFPVYKVKKLEGIIIDCVTKRGEITCFSGSEKNVPGLMVELTVDSVHYDKKSKEPWTHIEFPKYKGWNIFSAEISRYSLHVVFWKNR